MRLCSLPSPCYIIDQPALIANLEILRQVMQASGCKILLAQKAFSAYALYPLIAQYLSGAAASGLYEARLSREEMDKETHVFSPAFREDEIHEILQYADHIVFNSIDQLQRFGDLAVEANVEVGLRINPECSTQSGPAIYDPCSPGSRLGITAAVLSSRLPNIVDGLHFHTLCEQNADALSITMAAVEQKFAAQLRQVSWLNMGGGHHITRSDYDLDQLYHVLRHVRETYDLQIYLEPGEAVALNAGYLYCTVLDIVENQGLIAILDASAACHMPDVLEMPYRPPLLHAALPGEKPYTYRLAGPTCLAGDVIGEYSFDHPLQAGSRLFFADMAIYTMVKTNTFNGMPLPAIALKEGDEDYRVLKSFSYHDFKERLC